MLVENRQQLGFDQDIPQSGLCIWRIDDKKISKDGTDNAQEWKPGMKVAGHYRVSLIQADAKWDLENGKNSGDLGDVFHQHGIKELGSNITVYPNSGHYGENNNGELLIDSKVHIGRIYSLGKNQILFTVFCGK